VGVHVAVIVVVFFFLCRRGFRGGAEDIKSTGVFSWSPAGRGQSEVAAAGEECLK